jgi:hypothetical protein
VLTTPLILVWAADDGAIVIQAEKRRIEAVIFSRDIGGGMKLNFLFAIGNKIIL